MLRNDCPVYSEVIMRVFISVLSRIPRFSFRCGGFCGEIGEYLVRRYSAELQICTLTHTVTHTAKRPDGINGQESVKDHGPP